MSDSKTNPYVPYPHDMNGHLFQARMWRRYAMQWSDPRGRPWVEHILQIPRAECLRRALIHVQLAHTAARPRLP